MPTAIRTTSTHYTATMGTKTYAQNCGLARALDVLGERWTLLIVRDLGLGPRRYKDLLEGLAGIGTNLLADRLRRLEEAGVVERTMLPKPASVNAYALTTAGEQLLPVLGQLATWGLEHGRPLDDDDATRGTWLLLALFPTLYDPTIDTDVLDCIRVIVDEETACIAWTPAGPRRFLSDDGAPPVSATVTVDAVTLRHIVQGRTSLEEAISAGALSVNGPAETIRVLLDSAAAAFGSLTG